MGFTYTKGSASDRDRVRLEIGDTQLDQVLFEDAELDDLLLQEGSVLLAAAHACETLAVRYARQFDFSADGASFRKSTISQQYQRLAMRLRNRGAGTTVVVPQRVDGYSQDIGSDEVGL